MSRTLDEVRREGLNALEQRLGRADMIRFIQQFETGQGDYSSERQELAERLTLDDIQKQNGK
jgi:hypothetical protein